MASHIQNVNIKNWDSSPRASYTVTYTAERTGLNVTYTFTIKCYLHGSTTAHLGKGLGLKATLTVNGVSNSVTLKSTSDYWGDGGNGDTGVLYATKTVSVTCQSTTGQENQTVKFVVDRTDNGGSSGEVSTSNYYVTSPVLQTYTVAYNANGGNGAPSNQTKTYGVALTLSSTKPTRTGYSFQGWATSASGSVAYAAGASYTANAAVTLYAVWKINTYTVSYNANGGTDAPSDQTKTYGVALTLSSATPTRFGYAFLGWATSPGGNIAYSEAKGMTYESNASVTLYAVWEKLSLCKIHNGKSFEDYQVYIHDGNGFALYVLYIHDGSTWQRYS